jgi:hypothetical protein
VAVKDLDQHESQTSQQLDPISSLSSSSLETSTSSPLSSSPPTTKEDKGAQQRQSIVTHQTSAESEASNKAPSFSSQQQQTASIDPMYVKRIYRLAAPDEINMLLIKSQDEQRALVICQQKIKQRKLQMEAVDAEYQW